MIEKQPIRDILN